MTTYWGDFPTGATIRIPFDTFAGSTGASITMTNFLAADIEIYKNGGLTQRASDNGYTATTDFDGLTGLHMLVIDTSDNSDSGFFAAGNEYQVAVSTVTIDSQTVSFWAGTFSIERSGGALATLKDATYGLSAIETLVDDLESRLTSTRAGYLDNLSAGAVALQSSVDDLEGRLTSARAGYLDNLSAGAVALQSSVDDLEGRLGTPSDLGSGASIAANLVDIESQTDDLGAAGAGLSAIPWNAAWDAEVQSEVQDALEANNLDHLVGTATGIPSVPSGTYLDQVMDDGTASYDRTTDSLQALRDRGDSAWTTATLTAQNVWEYATRILTAGTNIVLAKGVGVTGFNDLSAAQVNTEVDTALSDYDGPTHAELVSEINSVQTDIAALNNLSAAQVNAEVVDALATDTYAEPGQGAPGATVSLATKINFLYKAFRNRYTQTSTEFKLYADNGTTVDQKATVSDDNTTFDRTEIGSGP